MAVAMVMDWAGITPEQYDEARKRVDWEGNPPTGAKFHVARFTDDGLHVLDVWETPEHFQRFGEERLMPVVKEMGIEGEPNVHFEPVHTVFNPGIDRAPTAVSA
jgi:hypothetical protein